MNYTINDQCTCIISINKDSHYIKFVKMSRFPKADAFVTVNNAMKTDLGISTAHAVTAKKGER
jgi:hypothetical protein